MVAMTNTELATWAAAAGTFAAAVVAVWIALWSHRNEVRRDVEREWRLRRDRAVTDLDETRRLVMTAIHRRDVLNDSLLFGTILHAIVHHSQLITDATRAEQMLRGWLHDTSGLDTLEKLEATLTERMELLRMAPLRSLLDPWATST
jgi:hypothetical protein